MKYEWELGEKRSRIRIFLSIEGNRTFGKTLINHYTEFLYKKKYQSIRYHRLSEAYRVMFYGKFMSCLGGDGQGLELY